MHNVEQQITAQTADADNKHPAASAYSYAAVPGAGEGKVKAGKSDLVVFVKEVDQHQNS